MATPGAEEFSLRRIAVPAFGPSAIWSIGAGAVLPVVALSARGLGASVGLAALFVGITTLSEFAAAVPAGVLVERIGERRALVAAGALDAVACALALVAPSLWVLGVAVFLMGPTGAVFLLARQSYLTAAAPVALRARAMSTLGGVTRIGLFVGPLIGAPVVARWGPQAAFAVAVVAGLLAALLALAHPRPRRPPRAAVRRARAGAGPPGRARRTVGCCSRWAWGCSPSGWPGPHGSSSCRCGPSTSGLDAAQTSLVFAAAALVEVVLFYPAGTVMDRHGRVWVAVPVTLLLGLGLVALPLTTTLAGVGGARAAHGRRQRPRLGHRHDPRRGCRALPSDARPSSACGGCSRSSGTTARPSSSAAVAAVATIGVASVAVGLLTLAGGAWLARWLPEYDPRRRLVATRSTQALTRRGVVGRPTRRAG